MTTYVFGDIETSCKLPGKDPLEEFGGQRYATHPSTRLTSAVAAKDAQAPILYRYHEAHANFATELRQLLILPDLKFVFHYALFELSILKHVYGVTIPLNRVIDTYAMLGYYGLPRSLDKGAQALRCSKLKDIGTGSSAMKEISKGLLTPDDAPELFEQMYAYNINDVEVTREIFYKLPPLPAAVQALWELDMEINMRGFPIDVEAARHAIVLRDSLKEEANETMANLTGGKITTVGQVGRIVEFAKEFGVIMEDGGADSVRRVLANPDTPLELRRVLALRQEAGLSSVAKYEHVINKEVDGRMHQQFDHNGCGTGRPKSWGFQALNLPRSASADVYAEALHDAPDLIPVVFSKPRQVLKEAIRGLICAKEGYELVGGDLGQIEARLTGWNADDQAFLDLFRSGDPYSAYAPNLWGHALDKSTMDPFAFLMKRTACKATILSMGFAGGIGAAQRGAETYGFSLDEVADLKLPSATPYELDRAHYSYHTYYLPKRPPKALTERQGMAADLLKQNYRRDFARIVSYWDELWHAFIHGGQAGPVSIERKAGLRILTLPSDRQLFYHDVRLHKRKILANHFGEELPDDDEGDNEEYWTYQARDKRKRIWKGTIMENVAQAENHDVSTWYMRQANEFIAPVVHQCYDEFTLEVPAAKVDWAKEQLAELVKTQPEWSKGLPIVFDIWSGKRYG